MTNKNVHISNEDVTTVPDDQDIEEFVSNVTPISRDSRDASIPDFVQSVLDSTRLAYSGVSSSWVEYEDMIISGSEYIKRLGRHNMPNQHRLHKHSNTNWHRETRSHRLVASARFRHPRINEADVKDAASKCAEYAAEAAVLEAIWQGDTSGALATFWVSWKVCMISKGFQVIARETNVHLLRKNEYSCWENHC